MNLNLLCRTGFILSFFWTVSGQARWATPYCEDLLALPLPVVAQSTTYTCGVACFDSALRYLRGSSPGEWALAYPLGATPTAGTSGSALVGLARQYGLFSSEQVFATLADLRRYLSAGEVVIVAWSSGGAPHYSLVRGLGLHHITLMDPWHAIENPFQYNRMWLSEFVPSWYDGISSFGTVIRLSHRPLVF